MKRKAIVFDLSTNALKQHYPGNNYRNAYKLVGKFLESNGFEHRQKSAYISIKPMSHAKAMLITAALHNKYPWLSKCVQQFDIFDSAARPSALAAFKDVSRASVEKEIMSSLSMSQLQKAAEIAEQVQQQAPQEQKRHNNRSKNDVSI